MTPSLQAHARPPEPLVLDLDATDDPIPGPPLGRFFPGYSTTDCSLPLAIFGGDPLLCARRRPADLDASAGSVTQRKRIGAPIRQAGPPRKGVIGADRGVCRDEIRRWGAEDGGDDVRGLAQTPRLVAAGAAEWEQVRERFEATRQPARVFAALRDRTWDTGSRERRVVARAEPLAQGANPRCGVPSLSLEDRAAPPRSEADSCGRGAMEDRIKEHQLPLVADRTGARTRRANPIRLSCSSLADGLREAWRRLGLAGPEWAEAPCPTIRRKRLKIGALVRVTVRKVGVRRSSRSPSAAGLRRGQAHLSRLRPSRLRC